MTAEPFRSDIQLMRAIIVLLVVADHLRLPGFSNGFLGVDIFFGISGCMMEKLYKANAMSFVRPLLDVIIGASGVPPERLGTGNR